MVNLFQCHLSYNRAKARLLQWEMTVGRWKNGSYFLFVFVQSGICCICKLSCTLFVTWTVRLYANTASITAGGGSSLATSILFSLYMQNEPERTFPAATYLLATLDQYLNKNNELYYNCKNIYITILVRHCDESCCSDCSCIVYTSTVVQRNNQRWSLQTQVSCSSSRACFEWGNSIKCIQSVIRVIRFFLV